MNKALLREVLLIEDNPGDVMLLRRMFAEQTPNNIIVNHVESMHAAEEFLATRAVGIILLDLGLPDAQGMDAVKRVRAASPRVPLVVLTGSIDESMALEALKEGAHEYLIKGELEPRGLMRAMRYATERQRMDDTLFVEMERAQVTLTSVGEAVICTNNSGHITFLNVVAETLTGWSRNAALGRPVGAVLRLVDGRSRQTIPDQTVAALNGSRTVHRQVDCILIRQNGAEVAIEDTVSPIHDREGRASGAVIVLRDVTEHIKAQHEIFESKRIFEDLFDNSDAAIVDRDFSRVFRAVQALKAQGVCDLRGYVAESSERLNALVDALDTNGANAAALRLFDVPSAKNINKQPAIIVEIADAILKGIRIIKRSDYLTTNSKPIPVLYSLRVPQTEEEARRVPIIIIDLSNIKLAEAARQATTAKSQFLSSMSHEIRTPLNGVIGNLELLALTALGDEQIELIGDADKAAKALLGLVGNILDFSKIEAGKLVTEMGDINPAALVEEAIDVLQSRARQKNIFISATFGPDLPSLVRGDAARVRQILLNLIGNAVKFTDQGGVQVNLVVTSWSENQCELRFNIYDSGRGFDELQKARLFEPFTQDRPSVDGLEGTGLGLSICKSLVEVFGGVIGCKAVPGEGATFSFTLPVSVVRRISSMGRPDLSGIKVALIGGGDGAGDSLHGYFRERGAEVIEVPTVAAALVRHGRGAAGIDVAILVSTDDDSEVGHLLRERHIVPLLYGSGYAARSRLRRGFAAIIPPDSSAEHLDRNIRILAGHDKARGRLAGQQAALESAISIDIAGKRVLVLEDRLVNQVVIQKQLKKLSINCTLAVDGMQGLAVLEYQEFDLILCDCSMPQMSGYEFTRELRRQEASKEGSRRMPIIALTANAFREDAERCFEAGMDDFMSKPVTMDRLSAMLVRWLKPAGTTPAAATQASTDVAAAAPLIDFSALIETMGTDDPQTLNQVLAAFLSAAGAALVQVEEAILSGDLKRVKAATHGAKGDARNAAATALADLYAELERKSKEGDRIAVHDLALLAAAEVRRVEECIRRHLGGANFDVEGSVNTSSWGKA